MISSITSWEGGSAKTGSALETPFGIHEIEAIMAAILRPKHKQCINTSFDYEFT
jgi:hypothetical protein